MHPQGHLEELCWLHPHRSSQAGSGADRSTTEAQICLSVLYTGTSPQAAWGNFCKRPTNSPLCAPRTLWPMSKSCCIHTKMPSISTHIHTIPHGSEIQTLSILVLQVHWNTTWQLGLTDWCSSKAEAHSSPGKILPAELYQLTRNTPSTSEKHRHNPSPVSAQRQK